MLRWPSSVEVLGAAARWAERQRGNHDDLLAVGVFGSYGRGDAGVGSDLDLILILKTCTDHAWERLRRWDTGSLPLACDLLVYSLAEWCSLPGWNPRLAEVLKHDTHWLAGQPPPAGEVGLQLGADLGGLKRDWEHGTTTAASPPIDRHRQQARNVDQALQRPDDPHLRAGFEPRDRADALQPRMELAIAENATPLVG